MQLHQNKMVMCFSITNSNNKATIQWWFVDLASSLLLLLLSRSPIATTQQPSPIILKLVEERELWQSEFTHISGLKLETGLCIFSSRLYSCISLLETCWSRKRRNGLQLPCQICILTKHVLNVSIGGERMGYDFLVRLLHPHKTIFFLCLLEGEEDS